MTVVSGYHPNPDLVPYAPAVGPFPHSPFLGAWLEELGSGVETLTAANAAAEVAVMRTERGWELLGDSDLTDYHSPLGTDLEPVIAELVGFVEGVPLVFDSLPEEAAGPLLAAFEDARCRVEREQHQVAMVLALPPTMDKFFEMLSKRDRHELRRKRRRYEEVVGPISHRSSGTRDFDEFVRLHRLSTGPKGSFMTGNRERFFARLSRQDGWRVDSLTSPSGGVVAALFGWSDEHAYYLYNSAYDPSYQAASPGLVVLLAMIEVSVEAGIATLDFLKGDEDYKQRLGAEPRPLYEVTAS